MSLFEESQSMNAVMKAYKDEIAERRGAPGNTHECYARIADAAECAEAQTKEWKENVKRMWESCKEGDATAFDAYAGQLANVAMLSAMNWLTVAAEATRALERGED